MKLPKIFDSKMFVTTVVIVLLGVFALELQQWQQRRKIDMEINKLISEQSDLEKRNKDLQESLKYFSSNEYKEKLAREQLGLKKDGEIVINFPDGGLVTKTKEVEPVPKNNLQKWWEYIFKIN